MAIADEVSFTHLDDCREGRYGRVVHRHYFNKRVQARGVVKKTLVLLNKPIIICYCLNCDAIISEPSYENITVCKCVGRS